METFNFQSLETPNMTEILKSLEQSMQSDSFGEALSQPEHPQLKDLIFEKWF
jgi:hypothetical protein